MSMARIPIGHGDVFTDNDEVTVSFHKIQDEELPPVLDDLALIHDAMTLVADLWPVPRSASITLETHQWEKLRRVLLMIPDLLDRAQT